MRRRRCTTLLLDRDGTLIEDMPYSGDATPVVPRPTVPAALSMARAAGLRLGVVTNQRGVTMEAVTDEGVRELHRRMTTLLGPFDVIRSCPHNANEGCSCRKPRPGLIRDAARALGVDTRECVVIGDRGCDIAAGLAAGSATVLVPSLATSVIDLDRAPLVVGSLWEAVTEVIGWPGDALVPRRARRNVSQ